MKDSKSLPYLDLGEDGIGGGDGVNVRALIEGTVIRHITERRVAEPVAFCTANKKFVTLINSNTVSISRLM